MQIRFSGLEWKVKEGNALGPGPNRWVRENVWLDRHGHLHLKIARNGDKWSCAEVSTLQRFGFGRYEFQIVGRVDTMNPNIVLGLFNYPTPDVGGDGTNEIDVELSRWSAPKAPVINYTVYPAKAGPRQKTRSFDMEQTGDETTHRFTWRSGGILFQSLRGHRSDDKNEIARWQIAAPAGEGAIPQKPLPLLLNLWLNQGRPPADNKEFEVIIAKVSYQAETG